LTALATRDPVNIGAGDSDVFQHVIIKRFKRFSDVAAFDNRGAAFDDSYCKRRHDSSRRRRAGLS
jgi:hypothetical protein